MRTLVIGPPSSLSHDSSSSAVDEIDTCAVHQIHRSIIADIADTYHMRPRRRACRALATAPRRLPRYVDANVDAEVLDPALQDLDGRVEDWHAESARAGRAHADRGDDAAEPCDDEDSEPEAQHVVARGVRKVWRVRRMSNQRRGGVRRR